MANGLLLGSDDQVAAWAFSTFHFVPMPYDRVYGVINKDGNLAGAVMLHCYNGADLQLSYYGPKTISLGMVKSIARAILAEFNVSRVTAMTSKRNKRLMHGMHKIGFRVEGAQRCFYGHHDTQRNTAVRFVMFRDQIEKFAGLPKPVFRKG